MSHRLVIRFDGIRNVHQWDRPAWVAAIWRLFALSGAFDNVTGFHDSKVPKGFVWSVSEESTPNHFSLEFVSIREDLVQALSNGARKSLEAGEALSLSEDVVLKVLDIIPVEDYRISDGQLRLSAVTEIIVNRHVRCGHGKRRFYPVCPFEDQPSYLGRLKQNLIAKVQAFRGRTPTKDEFGIRIISSGLERSVPYKTAPLRGRACSLQITGAKDILETALYAGVGKMNALGYGMMSPMRKEG